MYFSYVQMSYEASRLLICICTTNTLNNNEAKYIKKKFFSLLYSIINYKANFYKALLFNT